MYAMTPHLFSYFHMARYWLKGNVVEDYVDFPRPSHNLVIMKEGVAHLKEKDTSFTATPGDLFFIPKGATYSINWVGNPNVRVHTMHFAFQPSLDPLRNKRISIQKIPYPSTDKLAPLFDYMDAHQNSTDNSSFLFMSHFYQVCYEVFPHIVYQSTQPTMTKIQPALDYLDQNLFEEVNVEYLASLCYLSPSRFYLCFKEATGVSPIVYKNRLRIQNAAYALLSNSQKSVEKIAEECGFESAIYFRRLFKRITGKTPTEYRRNSQTF